MTVYFRRGTTPVIFVEFAAPIRPESVDKLYLTFTQGNTTVLEKTLADVTLRADCLYFRMTQRESLEFRAGNGKVQLRVKDKNAEAYADDETVYLVKDVLKDGEI